MGSSAGGAARLGIQVDSPPTAFSRRIILYLNKATVQRKVVTYRILRAPEKKYGVCEKNNLDDKYMCEIL